MKRLLTTIQLFCCCCAITWHAQSQNLLTPELSFTYACAKDSYNIFNAIISFEEKPFNTNNTFYLELSDAQGSFDSPFILKTITDENFSFGFETSFQLPTTVHGDNYRIRVRATAPAMISPVSDSFHAYYIPETTLVLNDYKDVSICGGTGATLSLNEDIAESYIWYKDGLFYGKGGASLQVTESGEYYVEPYYGDCTGTLYSNIVIVNFGDAFDSEIEGEAIVETCPGTVQTFSATTVDAAYTYRWYKDGALLKDLPDYTPHLRFTVDDTSYGQYHLVMINAGGCQSASQTVTLKLPENGFSVEAASDLQQVLLDGQNTSLEITTNASNATIVWYRNGTEVSRGSETRLQVDQVGTYSAGVTAQGGCSGLVVSPEFEVFSPIDFKVTIAQDMLYENCKSSSTELLMDSFTALGPNGFKAEIPETLWDNFSFNWLKDDVSLNDSRTNLSVGSYHDNGIYQLEVIYHENHYTSNPIDIRLGIPTPEMVSSHTMLCDGLQATLSATAFENAVYNWYKGAQLIATTTEAFAQVGETGNYHVEVVLNGCISVSQPVAIEPLSDEIVQIYPSETVYIAPEQSETIYATGATRYVWTDSSNLTVSSSDSFTASQEGTYTLTAFVDNCTITKTITVAISETFVVPNIITPNQDNINDKWILPAKFINDPEIEVLICDTYGKPILKTNNYQNNWPETMPSTDKSAIYYYFINKNGKALKKGSITVVSL